MFNSQRRTRVNHWWECCATSILNVGDIGGYDVNCFRTFMLAFIFSRAIEATSRPGLRGTYDIRSLPVYHRFQRLSNKSNTLKQLIEFPPVHMRNIAKCEFYEVSLLENILRNYNFIYFFGPWLASLLPSAQPMTNLLKLCLHVHWASQQSTIQRVGNYQMQGLRDSCVAGIFTFLITTLWIQ